MVSVSAVVGSVLVAACGSGGDTPATSPTTPSTAAAPSTPRASATSAKAPSTVDETSALRTTVQAYSDAYLTGKGEAAYALLSKRCQERMDRNQFVALVGQAKQMYGSALPIQTFKAEVSGDLARVTYTYSVSAINQDAEPWVRESGHWHEDDC